MLREAVLIYSTEFIFYTPRVGTLASYAAHSAVPYFDDTFCEYHNSLISHPSFLDFAFFLSSFFVCLFVRLSIICSSLFRAM